VHDMDSYDWGDYYAGLERLEMNRTASSDLYRALYARRKTCNRCGATGLVWGLYRYKWRLYSGDTLHVCQIRGK